MNKFVLSLVFILPLAAFSAFIIAKAASEHAIQAIAAGTVMVLMWTYYYVNHLADKIEAEDINDHLVEQYQKRLQLKLPKSAPPALQPYPLSHYIGEHGKVVIMSQVIKLLSPSSSNAT
jgi:hypothetical protein